jgi:hypothetical protein
MRFLSTLRSSAANKARAYGSAVLSLFRVHGAAMLSFFGAILAGIIIVADALSPSPISTFWKWLEALGVAMAASGALISSVQQNAASEELREKNLEIIDLHRKFFDTLTGGTSYCYLAILPDPESENLLSEYVYRMPPRQNSLYDVKMQYSDTSIALSHGEDYAEQLFELAKSGSFTAMGKAKYDRFKDFSVIPPIGFFKLWPFSLTRLPFVINARFYARNGWWHQTMIWVQGKDGKIARSDVVVRVIPRPRTASYEVLRQEVSKNFPDQ